MAKKAKVQQIAADKEIIINPKSKNQVFELVSDGITLTFKGEFTDSKNKAIKGYNTTFYNNIATKNNNDLILTTLFTTVSGKIKKVTTTIKNYFADTTKDYKVNYWRIVGSIGMNVTNIPIKPNSAETVDSLYGTNKVDTSISNYLLGTSGNDSFTFDYNAGNYVYDTKGNDEYLSVVDRQQCITDLAGNEEYTAHFGGILIAYDYKGSDNYTVTNNSKLYVYDYAGKDKYHTTGAGSNFNINDYNGNEIYEVNGNYATDGNKFINDYKGDDDYTVCSGSAIINDKGGKDYYKVNSGSTTFVLEDTGKGNDTFDIENCYNLAYESYKIYNEKGNETYNLKNVSYLESSYKSAFDEDDNIIKYAIADDNGNDKYNLDFIQYATLNDKKGNDKYTFLAEMGSSQDVVIVDEAGKDKYNLTNSENLTINDKKGDDKYTFSKTNEAPLSKITINDDGGKDSYTFTGTEQISNVQICDNTKSNDKYNVKNGIAISITDEGGKDSYNIADTNGMFIRDYGNQKDKYTINNSLDFRIWDEGDSSSDTYNIKGGYGFICDDGGNDSYTVEGMEFSEKKRIYIEDRGGNKDTLNIKGVNKSDIIYFTNIFLYDANNTFDNLKDDELKINGSLLIYNKKTNTYIDVTSFYQENDENIDGFGVGKIETFKINNKKVKDIYKADLYEQFNAVKENVAAWLANDSNQFSSVVKALEDGSEAQINELIQIFKGGNAG